MKPQLYNIRLETFEEYRQRRIRDLNRDIFELERRLANAREERAKLIAQ